MSATTIIGIFVIVGLILFCLLYGNVIEDMKLLEKRVEDLERKDIDRVTSRIINVLDNGIDDDNELHG